MQRLGQCRKNPQGILIWKTQSLVHCGFHVRLWTASRRWSVPWYNVTLYMETAVIIFSRKYVSKERRGDGEVFETFDLMVKIPWEGMDWWEGCASPPLRGLEWCSANEQNTPSRVSGGGNSQGAHRWVWFSSDHFGSLLPPTRDHVERRIKVLFSLGLQANDRRDREGQLMLAAFFCLFIWVLVPQADSLENFTELSVYVDFVEYRFFQ